MSLHEHLIKADRSKAIEQFLHGQKNAEKTKNIILGFAIFSGIMLLWITSDYFGETVSELCLLVAVIWYLLGYVYCKTLWDKEKDMWEFSKALTDYDKNHPDQIT